MRDIHREFHFRPYEDTSACNPREYGLRGNISTDSVRYAGCDLDTLGVKVGDRVESIIIRIDELFGNIITLLDKGWVANTIGGGIPIYKGINAEGIGEVKSFTSEGSIIIKDGDDLSLDVKEEWLDDKLNPVKEMITKNTDALKDMGGNFEVFKEQIKTLSDKTQGIIDDLSKIHATTLALEKRIDKLEELQKDIQNTFYSLHSQLENNMKFMNDSLNSRLNNIESSMFVLTVKQFTVKEGLKSDTANLLEYKLPDAVGQANIIMYNGITIDNQFFSSTQEGSIVKVIIKLDSLINNIEEDDYITIIYPIKPVKTGNDEV